MVILESQGVTFFTSNNYCLSWALAPSEMPEAVTYATIKLSREDLVAFEERARKGPKEIVHLDFDPGSGISYQGEDSEQDMLWDDIFEDSDIPDDEEFNSRDENMLAVFREIISERETDPATRQVALATEYIRKLGQVKKEDKNQCADLWFAEEDDAVLVKVGAHFMVAIEPIDHERHRAALGEGATW